jgi:hypothetical protein
VTPQECFRKNDEFQRSLATGIHFGNIAAASLVAWLEDGDHGQPTSEDWLGAKRDL